MKRKIIRGLKKYIAEPVLKMYYDQEYNGKAVGFLSSAIHEDFKYLPNRKYLLDQIPKNKRCLELGVDMGGFSNMILSVCSPSIFYGVDTWDSKRYGRLEKGIAEYVASTHGNALMVQADSISFLKKFKGEFDFIYIDTTHEYQQTLAELKYASNRLSAGGVLAGHDFCKGNIKKGLEYGVMQAVQDFCNSNGFQIKYLTSEEDASFGLVKCEANG